MKNLPTRIAFAARNVSGIGCAITLSFVLACSSDSPDQQESTRISAFAMALSALGMDGDESDDSTPGSSAASAPESDRERPDSGKAAATSTRRVSQNPASGLQSAKAVQSNSDSSLKERMERRKRNSGAAAAP